MPCEQEVPLQGGNTSAGVVRVGATVRKPWTSSTPFVVDFMTAMRSAGVDVPAMLGQDDQKRQILEFVPGPLAINADPLIGSELARVGEMVRAIHDAADEYEPVESPGDVLIPAPVGPRVLICHNDLAPWNLLIGDRWVFIDWDGAGPSTRVWDLAYSAQAFALSDVDEAPPRAAARLATFIDGYGADPVLRMQLPATMIARTQAMHELLASSRFSGREPWASMYTDGHGDHWRAVAQYVQRHQATWSRALSPDD